MKYSDLYLLQLINYGTSLGSYSDGRGLGRNLGSGFGFGWGSGDGINGGYGGGVFIINNI